METDNPYNLFSISKTDISLDNMQLRVKKKIQNESWKQELQLQQQLQVAQKNCTFLSFKDSC